MASPAIGYDDFAKHVLFPWTVEEPAHVEGGTPFECAALAAHAALSDFIKRPGTILVTAADSPDDSRATLALVKAFFIDHQQLAPLLVRTTVDGVELKGGTRIIVSHSSARRPKDLLRHIKLDRTAAIDARDIDRRNLARTILSIVSSEQREEGRPITERIRDCVGAVWDLLKSATITEPPESEPSNEEETYEPTRGRDDSDRA